MSEDAFNFHISCFSYAGIHPDTVTSIIRETQFAAQNGVDMGLSHHSDDALISRARSRAASKFLLESNKDVLVMVDRDIAWDAGMAAELAVVAKAKRALVAGLYSARGFGRVASRMPVPSDGFVPGGERLLPAEYLATGFLAIPREVLERMVGELCASPIPPDLAIHRCVPLMEGDPPFWDFFRPVSVVVDVPEGTTDLHEYLSEDYAMCLRARALGIPAFIWEKPVLRHWGLHPFVVPPPAPRPSLLVKP